MRFRSRYDGEILRLAVPALACSPPSPRTSWSTRRSSASAARSSRHWASLRGARDPVRDLQLPPVRNDRGVDREAWSGSGAGRPAARRPGARLGLGVGIALTLLLVAFAPSAVELMGGDGRTADYAVTYLRIVSPGFPSRSSRSAPRVSPRRRRPAHPALDHDRRQRRKRGAGGALRLRLRLGDRGLGLGHRPRAGRDGTAFLVLLGRAPFVPISGHSSR